MVSGQIATRFCHLVRAVTNAQVHIHLKRKCAVQRRTIHAAGGRDQAGQQSTDRLACGRMHVRRTAGLNAAYVYWVSRYQHPRRGIFDFTSLLSTTAAGGRVIVIAVCVPAWRPLACLSFDPRAWKVALRASRSEFRDLRAAPGACSTAKSSYSACKVVGGASHRERWSSTFDGAVVVGCCAQDYSALRDRHLTPRHTTRLVCCH